ncbi:MAG: hypothetical protein AAFV29_22580, partial [Myxococcota bacterium]
MRQRASPDNETGDMRRGKHPLRTIPSTSLPSVRSGRTVLLALGLVGAFAGGASAFSTQGQRWPNTAQQPVPYMVMPTGSADISDGSDLSAVQQAFSTWQDVSCSYLTFEEQTWSEPALVQNDGVNRIFWIEEAIGWPLRS